MTFKKIMHCLPLKILFALCAFLMPFAWMASIDFHYFYNYFTGSNYVMLALGILISAYVFVYLYFAAVKKPLEKKGFVVAYYVCSLLSVILFIGATVIVGILTFPVVRSAIIKELPYFVIGAVVLILLFSSSFDKKRVTAIVALSVISLTIIVGATVPLAKAGKFRFTASPSVFDRGENYVVVWATNVPSAGRIEYSFDGKDYVVFDENSGRINLSDSIHSVIVPKNHLDGTKYTVYSNKVLKSVAYGSQTGKEIAFSAIFSTEKTSDFTVNVITDNHDTDKKTFEKIAKITTRSTLVMLGDFADLIGDEKAIVDNLLYPAGLLTGGEKPVLYAKGNHDNRGEKANDIAKILHCDSFFYRTVIGNFRFTVFDSGEDKTDSFAEYGYADFDGYRKKQLVSANSLDYPDGLADVVIVHNPLYAPDEETRANFADFLRDKNVKICLSGHTHKFSLDYDVYKNGIPSLVCGGISERNGKKKGDLVYSVLRFSENAVSVKAFSAADGELRSENVSLK